MKLFFLVLTFSGSSLLFGGFFFNSFFNGLSAPFSTSLAASFFDNFQFFDEGRARGRVDLVDRARVGREVDFAVDVGGGADDVVVAARAPVDGSLVLGQKLFQATTLTADLALLDVVVGRNGALCKCEKCNSCPNAVQNAHRGFNLKMY